MRTILSLLLACFCMAAVAQSVTEDELFARITPEGFDITGDQKRLALEVAGLMKPEVQNPTDFAFSIIEGKTQGKRAGAYYAVVMRDSKQNLTVAKWLERRESGLYLVRNFTGENYHQIMTTGCIGVDECTPLAFADEGKIYWACGTRMVAEGECKKIAAVSIP